MQSFVIFILAAFASASITSPIAYYIGKRSRADVDKNLKDINAIRKSAEAIIESHKNVAEKYKEIAESHTITWQGFEENKPIVVLDKIYTNHPDDILKFMEIDLLKLDGELTAKMTINSNGPWTSYLNSNGWGTTTSKGKEPMKSGEWIELSPCTAKFGGSPQQIIAGVTNALRCEYFYKDNRWMRSANLQLTLKVEKKIDQQLEKPKIDFVEVKVAIPENLNFDETVKNQDDDLIVKRANEIAAELEIDEVLRNAVRKKLINIGG